MKYSSTNIMKYILSAILAVPIIALIGFIIVFGLFFCLILMAGESLSKTLDRH